MIHQFSCANYFLKFTLQIKLLTVADSFMVVIELRLEYCESTDSRVEAFQFSDIVLIMFFEKLVIPTVCSSKAQKTKFHFINFSFDHSSILFII